MYHKPFEPELYEKYDNIGKQSLLSFLVYKGHRIKDTEENYYADVLSEKDGIEYYHEVEVRASWKGPWPLHWTELRLPSRKRRLIQKHESVLFYVFRNDLKEFFIVHSKELTDDRLKVAYGPNIAIGEHFFHIPISRTKFVQLRNGKWI